MGKIFLFIFSVIFISHLTKCSAEVKKKKDDDSVNKFVHGIDEDEEYNNYNFFEKIFGRRGIIMYMMYHGRELEYREALAGHYVRYRQNKEKTQTRYVDLVKTMVENKYSKEDINDILDKIMNY